MYLDHVEDCTFSEGDAALVCSGGKIVSYQDAAQAHYIARDPVMDNRIWQACEVQRKGQK